MPCEGVDAASPFHGYSHGLLRRRQHRWLEDRRHALHRVPCDINGDDGTCAGCGLLLMSPAKQPGTRAVSHAGAGAAVAAGRSENRSKG